jgi:ribonuclease BN (tRNA processing enzyme)
LTKLAILGSGAAIKSIWAKTFYLLNTSTLIDVGSDPCPSLRKIGRDPGDIRTILITHLHGDHFFGLAFLIVEAAMQNEQAANDRNLQIFGPAGTSQAVRSLLLLAYPNSDPQDFLNNARVKFIEIEPEAQLEAENAVVTTFKTSHGRMTSIGYRFEWPAGPIIAFCGDSEVTPATLAAFSGSDLVVASTPSRDEHVAAHASLADYIAAKESGDLKARHLFATHRTDWVVNGHEWLSTPEDLSVYSVEAGCQPTLLSAASKS